MELLNQKSSVVSQGNINTDGREIWLKIPLRDKSTITESSSISK